MKPTTKLLIFLLILPVLALSGCTAENSAADAIQAYFKALAAKNASELALLSCSEWEAQAKNELESFGAVTVSLETPDCQINGDEGDYTLVSCSGKLIANYGNEILEIDLEDRIYLAANEGGEWRMCGYR